MVPQSSTAMLSTREQSLQAMQETVMLSTEKDIFFGAASSLLVRLDFLEVTMGC